MDQQPRPSNRRLSMRRRAKGSSKVTCRKGVLGLGPNYALKLLDLSEGGACFVARELMTKGQEVELSLLAPGGSREVVRKGQVAWAVEVEGKYHIGVSFDKRLEYAVVTQLGTLTTC